MKKQLKDLNISIPVIDVLESRKLFGGNGGYGDPPFSPESYGWWQDSEGNWHIDPPKNGGVLDEVEIRPENPDGGSGNNDPSDQNDDTDNGSSDQDGNNPGNGDQGDDGTSDGNDNDADDHREDNSDWEQDHANPPQNGNPTTGGNGEADNTAYGNPHDLTEFPVGGQPQLGGTGMCVSEVITQVLKYMGINESNGINDVIRYIANSNVASYGHLLNGLSVQEAENAVNLFFETNNLVSFQDIANALNNGNPLFAHYATGNQMSIKDDNGNTVTVNETHAVAIIGAQVENNTITTFACYDPVTGGIINVQADRIISAFELCDLDPDFLEYYERSNASNNQDDTNGDGEITYWN
jgi:hypothetical protein